MKWVFLLVALAAVLPLARWLRSNSRLTPVVWLVAGFLVMQNGSLHLYMAMDSLGDWPGYVHGAEISLLDLIALAIYFSLPRTSHVLPFRWAMASYFGATLLSVLQARVPVPAVFYAWQLIRVFFFYAVVVKASATDSRVIPALLKGMAFGLLLAACEAVWERFGLGILRTHGGYEQENFFGVVSHFVVVPFFMLLLAGERGWLPPTVSFVGLVISILTVSRATLAFTGMGYLIVFIMSIMRGWTPRKALIAVAAAATILAIAPLFMSSFADRFSGDIGSSFMGTDETRIALAKAAGMMLSDHPFGVGANQFVLVANSDNYYVRAGVSWFNYNATVHNVYWLVAAETGYVGLIAFVYLLIRPMITAFRCGWLHRADKRGDLLLGLGVALITVYLHSFYEWIFITFQVQYIFAATVGMIAGVAQQVGYWSTRQMVHTTRTPYLKAPKENVPATYQDMTRH